MVFVFCKNLISPIIDEQNRTSLKKNKDFFGKMFNRSSIRAEN